RSPDPWQTPHGNQQPREASFASALLTHSSSGQKNDHSLNCGMAISGTSGTAMLGRIGAGIPGSCGNDQLGRSSSGSSGTTSGTPNVGALGIACAFWGT